MRSTTKLTYSLILTSSLFFGTIPQAYSYGLRASNIYIQAKNNNTNFLKVLKRYNGIIDIPNEYGQTAYCLALRYNDTKTASLLKSYGADKNHKCVKEVKKAKKTPDGVAKIQRFKTAPQNKPRFKEESNPYLLWGGLALATAGAGVALSGGGGGGSDTSYVYGDAFIGNGGNTQGSVTANDFKTDEYKKSNYLKSTLAAEAYSYIYEKDERGDLKSHQANSSYPLQEVNVGILDIGTAKNNELRGKIAKGYDLNKYNSDGDILGAIQNNVQISMLKEGELYYPTVTVGNGLPNVYLPSDGLKRGFHEEELPVLLYNINKDHNTSFKLSDIEVMNGSDGFSPGTVLPENLENKIKKYESYKWIKGSYLGLDLSHGSHVAGIIAGNKNDKEGHGIAFENAKLYIASWDMQQNIYSTIKDMVDNDVQVINNSWGYSTKLGPKVGDATTPENLLNIDPTTLRSYAYAASNDVVWVQATGNDGTSQPSVHLGMEKMDLSQYGYHGHSDIEAPLIAVAMLDGSTATSSAPFGRINKDSNRCGVAAQYCLATEGTNVSSTAGLSNGSVLMTGTSMATPVVTGSIALLKGYYPWLKATNISYLLLETANNTGEYAQSEIYGRGVLNLEAAITTPLGDLRLPETSSLSNLKSASQSKLALSTPLQSQFLKSMPKTITAFDKLNRPFQYSTDNIIKTPHSSQASLKNAVSKIALGNSKKTIKDEKSGFSFSSSYAMDNGGNAHLSDVEVTTSSDTSSTRFYYQENSKYDGIDNLLKSSNNPYFAMNNAYGAENTINLSETSKLKLSLQTGENGLYERDKEQDNYTFDEQSYAFDAQYSFNTTDYLTMSVLGGLLFEEDALLGLNGAGLFNIQDSSTYYMGLQASLRLTPNLSLIAAYYRGFTSSSQSPMLSISDLQSESFMLASEYNLNKTDKIGLSLSSPLSVVKGNASIMYATGRDNYSNNAYIQKLKTSLKSPAKEYDLSLYYTGSKKDNDLSYQGKITTRFNADGNKGLTDYMGIMGMQYNF